MCNRLDRKAGILHISMKCDHSEIDRKEWYMEVCEILQGHNLDLVDNIDPFKPLEPNTEYHFRIKPRPPAGGRRNPIAESEFDRSVRH